MTTIGKFIFGKFLSLWCLVCVLCLFTGLVYMEEETLFRQILQAVIGLVGLTVFPHVQGGLDGKSVESRKKTAGATLFFGGELLCLGFFLKLLYMGARDLQLLFCPAAMLALLFVRRIGFQK